MKQSSFFRIIVGESLLRTWKEKGWWIIGLIALFLAGALGYQFILQGANQLAAPVDIVNNWEYWAQFDVLTLLKGQWQILITDPVSWIKVVMVWLVIGLAILAAFLLSVFSIALLISATKVGELKKDVRWVVVMNEAMRHIKGAFISMVLFQLGSYLLLLLLSVPVVWIAMQMTGVGAVIAWFASFFVFVILAFLLVVITIFTMQYIVIEDYEFTAAILAAWNFIKKHWLISFEMLFVQLLIAGLGLAIIQLFVSMITIVTTIVGILLVANEQFVITAFLPQSMFYLRVILFTAFGAVFTVFQLYSWTLLFMRFEEHNPRSYLYKMMEQLMGK